MSTTSQVWSTIGGSTFGLTMIPEQDSKPAPPPKALFATRAVQTQAGWVGQVFVDKEIIRETPPFEDSDEAIRSVNEHIVDRIKALFA